MARVGVVSEGIAEAVLIEQLVRRFLPGSEVRPIHPDTTLLSGLGNGWKGVRAWSRENSDRLESIMVGIQGDELDILVIHVDCSMAHNVGARRECPPASNTADALQDVLRIEWLNGAVLPNGVVFMTPSQSTDTWLFVGAGHPVPDTLDPLECSFAVEHELARLRHYRWKRGVIRKSRDAYETLSVATAERWSDVTGRCTQAATFWESFLVAIGAEEVG